MHRFPTRKLTQADGEYILWHVLQYYYQQECDNSVYGLYTGPAKIIRDLIDEIRYAKGEK